MTTIKRQASYFYAHTHNDGAASAVDKCRHQKEELRYTAVTIQSALANESRPPMPIFTGRRAYDFLLGSVDVELARVMTLSEFDCNEAETAVNGDGKTQEDQQQVEEKNDETQDDDPYGCGDVSSMYMVVSLI